MPRILYKLKDGTPVSGVTSILSANLGWNTQALMYWANQEGLAGRNHRDTAQAAADAGTIAHKMIECEIKGTAFNRLQYDKELLEKAETAYLGWLEWRDLVQFKVLESELSLVSEVYGFGGTLDIAAIKKQTCIIDLKTSKAVYPEHRIQVAAYGQLYNEKFSDTPIQAYYILQLGKEDGSFHYHYYPSLPQEWEAFKALLILNGLRKALK